MKRSRLNPIGKRGRAWIAARERIIPLLLARGIFGCEFRYFNCSGDARGGLAHAVKRRKLRSCAATGSPWHIETVARACRNCHRRLDEQMSHDEMREAVMGAIENREDR